MSFGVLANIGSDGAISDGLGVLNLSDAGDDGGFWDGISSIGRLRLSLDVPVKEDSEDSHWGKGMFTPA